MENTIPSNSSQDKPTPKTTFIYVLIDPETDQIRYVGKTNHLQNRLYRHTFDASDPKHNTYKDRWIRGLQSRGLKPIMQVIEEVPYEQWEARECYWIETYRAQGSPLTNTAKGGRGGQGITSDEARARISAAKKGTKYKPTSEEGRRNMSIAHKGRKMPREAVERAAAKRRGRKASLEVRAKLSESHKGQVPVMKGQKHTDEARAKMSAARLGKKFGPMPEETKRKISEAQIGKKVSDETRAKLSASHMGKPSPKKGRKMSPESRAKMSLAKKQMHAIRKNPPDVPTLWDHAV